MRYVCRTGCQWRNLLTCFPPWPSVYYYFVQWRVAGTFEQLSHTSNCADLLAQGRLPIPWLALVKARRVKLAPRLGPQRGLDAHKRVNGRKRHVLYDTRERIWQVVVHAANGHDSRSVQPLLP
jgi:transposase